MVIRTNGFTSGPGAAPTDRPAPPEQRALPIDVRDGDWRLWGVVGLPEDAATTVEQLLCRRDVYEPSPERHAMYEDLFGVYRSVSRRLLEDYEHLAEVSERHGLTSRG